MPVSEDFLTNGLENDRYLKALRLEGQLSHQESCFHVWSYTAFVLRTIISSVGE